MSRDRTRSEYPVALLVPLVQSSPDYVIDTSDITEADPIITEVLDQGSSELVLEAVGEVESNTHQEYRCLRGGNPGLGTSAAGLGWRNVADPEEEYRGQDQFNAIVERMVVEWTNGAGSLNTDVDAVAWPDQVALDDGTVVLAADITTHGNVGGNDRHVAIYRWTPGGGWSSYDIVHTADTDPTYPFHPALVLDPVTQILYLLHWVEDPAREQAQVRMHYSTDGGVTWQVGGRYVLPQALDIATGAYQLGKLSAGLADGDLLLLAELAVDAATPWASSHRQYASSSLGASFDLIEAYEGGVLGAAPYGRFEVLVVDGVFVVVHAGGGGSNEEGLYCHILPTAWDPLSQSREVVINANDVAGEHDVGTGYIDTRTDITAAVDYDGCIYVVFAYVDNSGYHDAIAISRSEDGGLSWTDMGSSDEVALANAGVLWRCGNNTHRLHQLALIAHRGRLLLAHVHESGAGTWDGSLAVSVLGGWTNRTRPGLDLFGRADRRGGFTKVWQAFGSPSAMGWTETAAGKAAAATTSGAWAIDTAVGSLTWSDNPTASQDQGIAWEGTVKVEGSPGTGSAQQAVRLRLADGVADYQVTVRIGTNTLAVYDDNGPTLLGSIAVPTQSAPFVLGVELMAGSCIVLARPYSAAQTERYWTGEVQSSALVNNSGAPSANNLRQWGAIASSSTGSLWYEVRAVAGEYLGLGRAAGFSSPDDLYPGPITSEPYPYGDGVYLYAVQGPAREGDEHRLQADHTHALRYAFPSILPSRRRGLRTTSDGVDLVVPIDLHATQDVPLPAAVAVSLLFGAGRAPRFVYLEGETSGGWVTLCSADAASGRIGTYALAGDVVTPDGGVGFTYHMEPNELVGDTVQLVGGGTKLRRVLASDGGIWDSAVVAQAERLILDDIDGTEPSGGTIRIWARKMVLIAHLDGTPYRALRVRVPAQSTVLGAFEVLWLDFAEVLVPALPPSAQWTWTLQPGAMMEEADDRSSTAYEVGEDVRILELPWVDFLPEHHVDGSAPDPGFVRLSSAANTQIAASMGDWTRRMQGAIRRLRGPLRPVGLVLGLTSGAPSSQVILGNSKILLGRIVNDLRIERVSPHGIRFPGLTIREEG